MRSINVTQRGAKLAPLAAAVAVAVIAAGAGYFFGTRQAPADRTAAGTVTSGAAQPAMPAATADASGRKVLYWHDPMVPGQKFDKPGKSPFMDMDLVPVYADAAADGGVAVSARQQQSFGVRTAAATEGTLDTGFSAVGAVVVDERSLVAVQARSRRLRRTPSRARAVRRRRGGAAAGRALCAGVARRAGGTAGAQGQFSGRRRKARRRGAASPVAARHARRRNRADRA